MTDLEEKDNEMEVDIAQNEQKKLESKMNEKDKDRFGDVPKVDAAEYIRNNEKVNAKTGHIKLRKKMKSVAARNKKAAEKAKMMELLDSAQPGEVSATVTKTYSQRDITKHADVQTLNKKFDLHLEMGPYKIEYDRSGRHLLMAGHLGHVSIIDHLAKKPLCEFSTNEIITDSIFLKNEMMIACAQKKWTYIYDSQGTELHCLKQMNNVNKLHYLPFHFLMTSINSHGYLQYLDISLGKEIFCNHVGEPGSLNVMKSNPTNGIIHLGHSNGTVTLWSPNQKSYVAKMLCHTSNILDTSISLDGNYMATSSMDSSIRIWDLRTWKNIAIHRLPKGARNIQFSQKGKLATAFENVVEVWNEPWNPEKCEKPYASHTIPTQIRSISFCPFEDVLGIGSKQGFSSILVPGAGEPNPDSYSFNPFQTKKQRGQTEVRMLLEKCPPETIALDPTLLAKLDQDKVEEFDEEKLKRVGFKPDRNFDVKVKKRGRSKAGNKEVRKRKMREQAMQKSGHLDKKRQEKVQKFKQEKAKDVLARFMKRDV